MDRIHCCLALSSRSLPPLHAVAVPCDSANKEKIRVTAVKEAYKLIMLVIESMLQ